MPDPTDAPPSPPRVVRVIPDVVGVTRRFDYRVPEALGVEALRVGAEVRVPLQGRTVRGWVAAVDVDPPEGVELQPIAAWRSHGPAPAVVELAQWAAWRWAGHPAHLLRTASAPTIARSIPPSPTAAPVPATVPGAPGERLVGDALDAGVAAVRLAPGIDRFGFLVAAITHARDRLAAVDPARVPTSSVLVVCPTIDAARRLAPRLRRAGIATSLLADDRPSSTSTVRWAEAAAGGRVVVGARSAAWAPAPDLALGVLVDEHDEAHQSEQTPTWHARDVLVERCRRAEAPCVLLSAAPTVEALAIAELITSSRSEERAGWPPVTVLDRRDEDPATTSGLFPPRLAETLRVGGRAICVLNRTGRTRLLACRACDALASCDRCGASMGSDDDGLLRCRRCEATRPVVCDACGATAFRVARVGVGRARDELEAILGEPVVEVSGAAAADPVQLAAIERTRVLIGTEAVLHRVGQAAVVAFVDFDQELTAPRFRAGEQAMALLVRAARLAGPRRRGHHLVVQTRLPKHPVIQSVVHAEPGRLADAESEVRAALGFPPFAALAQVSGAGAASFIEGIEGTAATSGTALSGRAGSGVTLPGVTVSGVTVSGGPGGAWLVRAPNHEVLCDVLARTPRPAERVRIAVDPPRV